MNPFKRIEEALLRHLARNDPAYTTTLGNIHLYVAQGDITKTPVDAIVTPINSAGQWYGGVDDAIRNVAKGAYHAAARAAMPLRNLQTVVAMGDHHMHKGHFDHVIFVVDDLESSLEEVVHAGLYAAARKGIRHLGMPIMRTGVMQGIIEKTPTEAMLAIGAGIERFAHEYAHEKAPDCITFTVYKDPNAAQKLRKVLYTLK